MGSSIVLKMINVTHYYRNQKKQNVLKPFSYQPEDIELNNISLHIYEGEALGIIGEAESSKSLVGEILAGTVEPDKGRIARTTSLFYVNMNQKTVEDVAVVDYVKDVIQLFPYDPPEHKVTQIIKYAHLDDVQTSRVKDLTDAQYAQLLFSLARASEAKIVILSHILSRLDADFFEKAKAMYQDYVQREWSWITIDNDVDKIKAVSNYLAWISHGQLRKEGSINQVLPYFLSHQRDMASLKSTEEMHHFDEDWKRNRTRVPEMTYNFRRIERYQHAQPPVFLARIWTGSALFFVGMCIAGLFVFNNIGKVASAPLATQSTISKSNTDPYTEKLAYGIVKDKEVTLTAIEGNHAAIQLPRYAVASILGENKTTYKIEVDDKSYQADKDAFEYLNPAALYKEVERKQLEPFMKSNYLTSIDYFNSALHHNHKKVNETLVPEHEQRFVEPIVEQPIDMLFDDRNRLIGFTFPIVQQDKFKDEFKIKSDLWIGKTDSGYWVADLKNSKWIYIEL
ncbi:ATP-binding cassette domain-containing protein [Staphylococcus lutrae]|uniref:Teichoic acid ABC transporter ATP-binding protein n=1 Tax=Staphylococcus lutrae TaxID=155085 RepID=A0AAC9RMR5_9STAP|nr:ATP-binding cassette domain-containing protein [Staphylococcus lutrae]ARJ50138.1 teichoic acid ABC transporter ATP-binding protein [Staphylococcus lutrae]PNZ38068.1 teichoic acid ABC transporter ATP-binding protein [Staphylococcus lutrae]